MKKNVDAPLKRQRKRARKKQSAERASSPTAAPTRRQHAALSRIARVTASPPFLFPTPLEARVSFLSDRRSRVSTLRHCHPTPPPPPQSLRASRLRARPTFPCDRRAGDGNRDAPRHRHATARKCGGGGNRRNRVEPRAASRLRRASRAARGLGRSGPGRRMANPPPCPTPPALTWRSRPASASQVGCGAPEGFRA